MLLSTRQYRFQQKLRKRQKTDSTVHPQSLIVTLGPIHYMAVQPSL